MSLGRYGVCNGRYCIASMQVTNKVVTTMMLPFVYVLHTHDLPGLALCFLRRAQLYACRGIGAQQIFYLPCFTTSYS